MKVDINDTYGDYSDPDPVMEMEDSNLDYTGLYEEGTTMARDNNSQYEYWRKNIEIQDIELRIFYI